MTLLKLTDNNFSPSLEEPLQEVTLEDWREAPQNHEGATALVISNDVSVLELDDDLDAFDVIILDFPKFADGRAYSQGRLLRQRLGYTGEIRARGNVLRDQIFFMVRCGFDAFEFDGQSSDEANAALREFTFVYQPAANGQSPVWRLRKERAAAAA